MVDSADRQEGPGGRGRLLKSGEFLGGGNVPGDMRLAAGDRVPHDVVGVVEDLLDLQAGPVSGDPEVPASWSFTRRARVPVIIRTVPAGAPGGSSAAPNCARVDRQLGLGRWPRTSPRRTRSGTACTIRFTGTSAGGRGRTGALSSWTWSPYPSADSGGAGLGRRGHGSGLVRVPAPAEHRGGRVQARLVPVTAWAGVGEGEALRAG